MLATRCKNLADENQRLKNANPYETSLMNSFAFTNTVQAFMALKDPLASQVQPNGLCQVKITAPDQNKGIAQTLNTIATSVGCNIVTLPGDENNNPDVEREALGGIVDGAVLIHAARNNARAAGFVTAMSNSFKVKRTYDLPAGSLPTLVWVQIGSGDVWRKSS
jgi:hypothetical protein